jgi:hypothetical protein
LNHEFIGAWIYLDNPKLKQLSTYGNTTAGYHCFDDMGLVCKYDVANGEGGLSTKESSIHELLTTPLHIQRVIVIRGAPLAGKTVLACALASELSVMYSPVQSLREIGFGLFRSIEIVKKYVEYLGPRKVIVFDDTKAGASRRKDVDLGDFLSNPFG